jgi:hypothetical protein
VLLVPAPAVSELPRPHALKIALNAKETNNTSLSFIIICELRKR